MYYLPTTRTVSFDQPQEDTKISTLHTIAGLVNRQASGFIFEKGNRAILEEIKCQSMNKAEF